MQRTMNNTEPCMKKGEVRGINKIWMSQKEAQRYLGVSKDWLKDRRMEGVLHFSIVGKTAFYIKSEIDALIRKSAVTGAAIFNGL